MKQIIIYAAIALIALTLSSCKKDCNGSFTIEGTLWNGTKNKPRAGVLVEAVAGKGNSLFSTGSNVKDVGSARTDENGKFKINYNCVGDDMDGISLRSSDLQYKSISAENRLPINQNYSQFYNIPDSVSLDIFIKQTQGLGSTDTLYVTIGVPDMIEKLVFTRQDVPNGFYKRIRIAYSLAISLRSSLTIFYAIGYQNYLQAYKTDWSSQNSNNIAKLEPEINSYTIGY